MSKQGLFIIIEPIVKEGYINLYGIDVTHRQQVEKEVKMQLDELQCWQSVTIGRENRIMELKHELNTLRVKTNQPIHDPNAESKKKLEK